MQLGPYQLQVFTSLVVILGAAFVALICDLLKGNNEQLRELAIELKVRREEEHKRFQMMTPRVAAAGAGEKIATAVPPVEERKRHAARSLAAPAEKTAETKEQRRIAPEALAAIQRGAERAGAPVARRSPRTAELVAEPAVVENLMASKAAVTEAARLQAEPLQQVIAAAAQAEAAQVESAQTETVQPEIVVEPAAAPALTIAAASVRTAPVRMSVRPPSGAARNWGSLLDARRTGASSEKSGLLEAVVAATASTASAQAAEPPLPAGLQDGFVLTRLVESRQPVSGLVVSIGVNAPAGTDGEVPADVRALIQSLIGGGDFAAQSSAREFLLIYPGERGAAAQRRLTQIAQQLWDYQLSSLGTASILFSWGGVEVRSESIDEAIASATERMQETRRGRQVAESHEGPLAKAV